MTARVARPPAQRPVSLEAVTMLADSVVGSIEEMAQFPHERDGVMESALTLVKGRCLVDPDAAGIETWESVVLGMQLGSAMFESAGQVGTVTCRIGHQLRDVRAAGPGPRPWAHAGNWLRSFWLAIICREQQRMTRLCEFPLDVLRESPALRFDEYTYLWIDTLQAYWLERPGLVDKLIATIDASFPEVATIAPRGMLQQLLYPPIDLFYRFIRRQHEGFSEALVSALELHRAYWTAKAEGGDFADVVDGAVALGPLAIACLAYDAGYPIDIESEYLPKHLLIRSWLGEFET